MKAEPKVTPNSKADSARISMLTCPRCPHHDVHETVIHGVKMRLCAWCGHLWKADEKESEP